MAMRSASSVVSRSTLGRFMSNSHLPRYFSSDGGKGGVLDDKERAQETVYIKKMERERLEKQKAQMDKENAEKGKDAAEKKSKDEARKD
ncbi:hypothetical protein RND81_04G186500 [Saponaria officinalis]|uniref:ATPase inhibitor n=1 Tax=Saponaria officinalis TaxID=3572 RepID=A0AAW1LMB6_SAPOF